MDDLKVLVVDDEEAMRDITKRIVTKVDGFILVGEAFDGEDALSKVKLLKPDVVFLDVDMPVMNGVDCAKNIQDIDPTIKIIFATAFDGYMSDAFEVYAFDYLVKPYKVERAIQTLEKIKQRQSLTSNENNQEGKTIVANRKQVKGRLMLKHKEGISFVDLNDILLIQREDRATVLYTCDDERFLSTDSLSEMESRLPKDVFFRCHKSYIINLNHIKDITPYGRWTYVVRLENTKHDALITHEKYEMLESMFV